jgi:hypothetical protein
VVRQYPRVGSSFVPRESGVVNSSLGWLLPVVPTVPDTSPAHWVPDGESAE